MAEEKVTVAGPFRLGLPAVIVHGGAGGWRGLHSEEEVVAAVSRAAEAAQGAGNALDAVVEAIRVMEDSGVLNAGLGSVVNYEGEVEMDAGLMSGDLRVAGGVAAVRYPRNPIVLAAWIARNLPHVLLAGPAADKLAERLGLPRHPGPQERVLKRWKELRKLIQEGALDRVPPHVAALARLYGGDTVGAAAVWPGGGAAAGTSTGGLMMKHPGRVGDSPVPGAGFYAEDGVGACAATGVGETILLARPCIHAIELLREGVPVEAAAEAAVARHTRLMGSDNLGIVLVSADGYAAAAMNTEAMPIAASGPEARAAALLRRGGKIK